MNIDFYRNYIEIVELGTLSAAALSLHVAQSALSNQLKQFEEEYGTDLFVRASRRMELTEAGRILYKKAKDIIALVDAAHKEIEASIEGSQGCLRLGMTQAYPDLYMNNVLLQFQKENPRMRFEIFEESSLEILEQLRSGVIEIGIERNPDKLPPFLLAQVSMSERVYAYVKRDNPWIDMNAKSLDVCQLEKAPIAISRGIVDLFNDIFERVEISPRIVSISTSRSNPMMWAQAGVAIAIIRAGESEFADDPDCIRIPLESSDPVISKELETSRCVVTVRDTTLSAAAQRFVEFIRNYNSTK
ncbi:MAG: LysR family transcriptional regulator [Firmicutes bacterium]|nr:LysR family transcriptional regulator [Bacillota bacterium]